MADRVDLFVGDLHALLLGIDSQQHLGADDQEAGRDPLLVSLCDRIEREQVPGDLLRQKLDRTAGPR